jgi:hypothetical protein
VTEQALTKQEADSLIAGLRERFSDGGEMASFLRSQTQTETNLRFLAECVPEELVALDQLTRDGSPWLVKNWADTLNRIPFEKNQFNTVDEQVAQIRQTKVIIDLVTELNGSDGDPNQYLRSAAKRGLVDAVATGDHDTIRAAFLLAWLRPAEMRAYGPVSYVEVNYEEDRPLLEFIKQHFNKVMDLRDVLRERGPAIDLAIMESIVNSRTRALADGAL